ncbi:hypothetical protein PRtIB026_A21450 [Pseudomonas sp. RtIB026]|uniref:hypothetical protein n=1 Tax=Pseudomonas sp. RtIB026 TaxID=2749999 RepID=UPI001AF4E14A|nr:hypothetical protein [Pseudomonas sp. RtIB026]BCJ08178.1 hypothetical protein PRtIB026_A21450 [Pseudomonas sp. RtIB026]
MSQPEELPEAVDLSTPEPLSPFQQLLERSEVFATLRDLIQRVYQPSAEEVVTKHHLVIVGGQSLALWSRQYLIDELTGEEVGFVTSDDLDFIGKSSSIEHCQQALNIDFRKASIEDNTPNLAIGLYEWQKDKNLVVDILGEIAGVEEKVLLKNLSFIDLEGVAVAVIDPVTCVQSRLANLFALWQSNTHREAIRTKIAIRAANCFIREILVHDGYRAAATIIRRVKKLALSDYGKRVFVEYGIDIFSAIPHDPAIFPELYNIRERPKSVTQLEDLRRRKLVQYNRFGRSNDIHESHIRPQTAPTDTR